MGFASPLQRQTRVYLQGCESMARPFNECVALSNFQLELPLELAKEQRPHPLMEYTLVPVRSVTERAVNWQDLSGRL